MFFSYKYLVMSMYLTVTNATPLRYAPKGAKMHSKSDFLLDNVVSYVGIVQKSEDQGQELLKIS